MQGFHSRAPAFIGEMCTAEHRSPQGDYLPNRWRQVARYSPKSLLKPLTLHYTAQAERYMCRIMLQISLHLGIKSLHIKLWWAKGRNLSKKWENIPQKDPSIMLCFLIQYELEWNPIWSNSSAWSMRPRGAAGLPPNRCTQNYTKTSHLILWEMKVFWGVKGKFYFLTSEHPHTKKHCIHVTWVMKRPNGLRTGFYLLRHCLCTEWNWNRKWTVSPLTSIWE